MTTEEKLLKLRKLADAMYYAAQHLTTDASRLHKAMDEYHKFIIYECKEEPVSEDLKEAYESYTDSRLVLLRPDIADMACDRITKMSFDVFDGSELEAAFYEGANWQKEQLLAKAVDGTVHHFEKCGVASVHYTDPTGVPMAYFTSPEGLSAGDKIKIIVIKED